jgi:hypothetical protein
VLRHLPANAWVGLTSAVIEEAGPTMGKKDDGVE